MMPASASGVSITRSAPNSSYRPLVARNTPPNLPTSSPSTTTRGSARIWICSALRTASMRFIVATACSGCYVAGGGVSMAGEVLYERSVFWILLVVLAVIGGATAVTVSRNRRALPSGGTPRALPAGAGDKLLERTVRDVRVDDVVTIDGRDFLCEGVIDYDEDGHKWKGGRVVDGSDERWVVLGLERVGGSQRLCTVDTATAITGYPPEALVIG